MRLPPWCLRPRNVGLGDANAWVGGALRLGGWCLRPRNVGLGDANGWEGGACAHETWGSGMPAARRVVPVPTKRGVWPCLQLPGSCLHPRNVGVGDACGCPSHACAHEMWVSGCQRLAGWCLRPRSVGFGDACGWEGGACTHETWGAGMPTAGRVVPAARKRMHCLPAGAPSGRIVHGLISL